MGVLLMIKEKEGGREEENRRASVLISKKLQAEASVVTVALLQLESRVRTMLKSEVSALKCSAITVLIL